MKTYPYQGIVSDVWTVRQIAEKWRPAIAGNYSVLSKFAVATATLVVLAFLIWQTAATESLWARFVCCFLLTVISVLLGIRVGTNSSVAYITDVHRLNKALAEHNQQLQEANALLLVQFTADLKTSSQNH